MVDSSDRGSCSIEHASDVFEGIVENRAQNQDVIFIFFEVLFEQSQNIVIILLIIDRDVFRERIDSVSLFDGVDRKVTGDLAHVGDEITLILELALIKNANESLIDDAIG